MMYFKINDVIVLIRQTYLFPQREYKDLYSLYIFYMILWFIYFINFYDLYDFMSWFYYGLCFIDGIVLNPPTNLPNFEPNYLFVLLRLHFSPYTDV